jgi:hypothetical protein
MIFKEKTPANFGVRKQMKTNNRIYLITLIALVTAFIGFSQLLTSNEVSAQKSDNSINANSEMIAYALTYETNDLAARFYIINQLPCTDLGSEELSGKKIPAGVYCVNNVNLTKNLTLDGGNDNSAIFIFRVKSTLKTIDGASINLENGARSANVHFVADSVEIGAGSQFNGNVLTDNAINVASGAIVKGHLRSVSSDVNVSADAVNAPEEPGFIEICKAAAQGSGAPAPLGLGGRTFNFTITAANGTVQTVPVVVGACSGPISVEQGAASIVESSSGESGSNGGYQLIAVNTLTRRSSSTLGTVNLATRTVNVNVGAGSSDNRLALQFVNQTAITGFIEICKEAAKNSGVADPDVSGFFTFNIEGIFTTDPTTGVRTLTPFTVTAGQCTGAIAVTVPLNGFVPYGDVRVSELGRADGSVYLESVSALNNREIVQEMLNFRVNEFGNVVPNAGGGFSTIRVFAGDATQEALVTFINRSTPGNLKVCKIAGPGIPLNTPFTFTVNGTARIGTGTASDPFGTAAVTRTVIVPAGAATTANPLGNCLFVGIAESPADSGTSTGPFQNFVVGTPVTINEISPTAITANNSTNGFRPGEVRTASIAVSQGPVDSSLIPNATRISTATFNARREVVSATFTNYTFRPATLKICKIGTGAAIGQSFNFSVTQNNPVLPAQTATVIGLTAGTASIGGNCSVVGGSANATIFNANASYTVQETTTTGILISVACPTCAGSQPTTQNVPFIISNPLNPGRSIFLGTAGSANVGLQGLRTDVSVNQVVFTNAVSIGDPFVTPFDFDGDGKADLLTYNPTNGTWRIRYSSSDTTVTTQYGQAGDKPVPADYDGDGKNDFAVYRAGVWFIQQSRDGFRAIRFGEAGDIPQPGDFDGDQKADIERHLVYPRINSRLLGRAVRFIE